MSVRTMWLILCMCALALAQEERPRVSTTQGVVVGQRVEDGDYLTFYGIHYGGNTSGENRFKAPTPPPIYAEEFIADDNTVVCAQPSSRGLVGTEDCLVLNIFTKNITTPQPVLVWIEGEDYQSSNSTKYPIKNLVQEDLVVVTINYRLSIFGFLCLGVSDAPGNAGLKDIVQGLKWIRANIAGFGGDPNNIVLIGHGSGAAMVELITLSPLSQNLADKAIALSGSALAPWAVSYNPIGHAQRVGEKLGYNVTIIENLAKKLASTDINLLSGVLTDFEFYNASLLFAPCVENVNLNPNDTFLPDAPINIIKTGKFSQIPYLTAFVDREGTFRAPQVVDNNWLEKMETNFSNFVPVDLAFESEEDKAVIARRISEFYFEGKTINMETIEDYLEYHGDILIILPIIRGAFERARKSSENVYVLKFGFKGTYNSDWAYPQIPLSGARHGAILNYLLNFDLQSFDQMANIGVAKRFREFAYTGSPTMPPPHTGIIWIPVTRQAMSILYFRGVEIVPNITLFREEVSRITKRDTRRFWDQIHETHYVPPEPVSSANCLLTFGLVVLATQMLLRFFY